MSRILLAPMEGLADWVLRDVLTQIGGYDAAVTEFVRVSGSVLPPRSFLRVCPELAQGCRTPAGVPLAVQLLGSDPECMAENAAQLVGLSPLGIDLNFGCPAKTVNRHGGGAMLLSDPPLLCRIVRAVRGAVPAEIPVSAKMRLGITDTARAIACAQALVEGGAASLVVHARTREEGYRPPAHWEWIARIAEAVTVPVIANGEVWTVEDWRRCVAVSTCTDVMIGRGAVSDPFLALRIKGLMPETPSREEWPQLMALIVDYWEKVHGRVLACHAPGRLKLLVNYFRRTWPEADALHAAIRTLRVPDEVGNTLASFSAACQEKP